MPTIQFQGTRDDVRQVVNRLAGILSGREPDSQGIARGFQTAIGFGALSDIKDAFVTKAAGGTDEMGIKWPPLTKKYLAYGRRFGKGEQTALKASAGLGRGHRFAPGGNKGLLTAAQLKRWRQIFRECVARFSKTMSLGQAEANAAVIAWATLKREGAKTMLEVYGNRTVQILRDTGVLLNSLSPGIYSQGGYQKPTSKGGEDQIFEVGPGTVTVGTNVEYAAVHNFGSKKMRIPRRQFLPDSSEQVPEVWWERWFAIATQALQKGAAMMFAGKS